MSSPSRADARLYNVRAIKACLEYLANEAKAAGLTLTAHLVAAAAQSVDEEMRTMTADNVVVLPLPPGGGPRQSNPSDLML